MHDVGGLLFGVDHSHILTKVTSPQPSERAPGYSQSAQHPSDYMTERMTENIGGTSEGIKAHLLGSKHTQTGLTEAAVFVREDNGCVGFTSSAQQSTTALLSARSSL